MLPDPIKERLLEIAAHFGERKEHEVKGDLEAYLLSMLTLIRKELPVVSAMLKFTIEMAGYDGYLKEARQCLDQSAKGDESGTVPATSATQ